MLHQVIADRRQAFEKLDPAEQTDLLLSIASSDDGITICPDCSSAANGNGPSGVYCAFCQKYVVRFGAAAAA